MTTIEDLRGEIGELKRERNEARALVAKLRWRFALAVKVYPGTYDEVDAADDALARWAEGC